MDILAVGSVAYDSVKTPHGDHKNLLGGAATYLSTAAAYFAKVGLVGVVGEDFEPKHRSFFEARGIDIQGLLQAQGKTFRWQGAYTGNMAEAQTLDTQLNVFEHFRPELTPAHRKAPYVALGNIDPELQGHVLDQLDAPVCVACDTMNFWIDTKRDALLRTIARVDLLSINDAEARDLGQDQNLVVAGQNILAMGPKILVIKRGEHGTMLFHPEGIFALPAMPLHTVRDPTGAGDTFAGGMMGSLAQSGSLDFNAAKTAVALGTVMASFTVQQFSLNGLETLDHKQIQERWNALAKATGWGEIAQMWRSKAAS